MQISITELRSDIYKYFKYIQSIKKSLVVTTKTGQFSINYNHKKISLDLLEGLDLIEGDPEDLIHMDYNIEWREKENLT